MALEVLLEVFLPDLVQLELDLRLSLLDALLDFLFLLG